MRFALLIAASALTVAFVNGCSSPAGSSNPSGSASSSQADTASYCDVLCSRRSECDHAQDKETCVSECTTANAATLPKLRSDVVSGTTACLKDDDCHAILEENAVGDCVDVELVSIAPNDATEKFCTALEDAMDKCDASIERASCLELGKRFSDATLAQATECTQKTCGQMAECVDSVLSLK